MRNLRVFVPLAGRGKKGPPVLSRLLSVVQDGIPLLQPVGKLFTAFLSVPSQTPVDVAVKLAEAFGKTGIQLLSPEQRTTLALQVSGTALGLGPDVAGALSRTAAVEQATGYKGQEMVLRMQQEEELVGLRRAVDVSQVVVGDARMELQAWQYEAQGRILGQLFLEFTGAQTIEARVEIAGHAGPLLEALEKQLQALRDTKMANAADEEALRAQIEEVQNDVLMLKTLRAVKEGQPPDEELLRRMALYYGERVPQGQPAMAGTGSFGTKGRGKGGGGKGHGKAGGGASGGGGTGGTQGGGSHGSVGSGTGGSHGGGTTAHGSHGGGGTGTKTGGKKPGKGKKAPSGPGPGPTLH